MSDSAALSAHGVMSESVRSEARHQAPGFVVLLIIVGAQFMLVLDTNIMNVALPTCTRARRP